MPSGRRASARGRARILDVARELEPHGAYLFFKHGAHFHDPLVPREWAALDREPALDDAGVLRIVLDELPARLPRRAVLGAEGMRAEGVVHPTPGALRRGIYSPVPIARGIESGRALEDLLEEFRYEMIRVDCDQRWVWMGRPVAPRIRTFFLEHLRWEPALGRWCFEYQVNPEWWDKSYLDAEVTPLQAIAVREQDGTLDATLNTGASDRLDLDTLRLDARERLFCRSARLGEVMFADTARFSILRHANEACDAVFIAGSWRPLHWPPDAAR
jgi:hypothetical protein